MRLDYYVPSEQLRDQLTVHAVVDDVVLAATETLPAMLPNLHIRLAGRSAYVTAEGSWVEAPRLSVLGPSDGAYRMLLEPGLVMLSVGLLPKGWHTLVGVPCHELANQVVDGEDLWGAPAVERLIAQLLQHRSDASRCRVFEDFLVGRARPQTNRVATALQHVDAWLEHSRGLCLDQLSWQLGLGQRHLRRLTLDLYGASPKTLAMKYRALRAAATLACSGRPGMDEALAMYVDQSHLTRDFKRFVGWTPAAFADQRRQVTAATFAGRRAAGAVRPLALLS